MEISSSEQWPAEQRLLEAVVQGKEADLRVNSEQGTDASQGLSWGRERTVRAQFLCELLAAKGEGVSVHPRGIRLQGARIAGELDLEAFDIPCPLTFRDCYFDNAIVLALARVTALRLLGCHVHEINAAQVVTRGNLALAEGFHAEGRVRLNGAQIGGNLECGSGVFKNPGGRALDARGAKIGGAMFLRERFQAEGEVNLIGAQMGGNLECGSGVFKNPGGRALDARGAKIGGAVFLREGFQAEGDVNLIGARVERDLDCRSGCFRNPGHYALSVQRANIGGGVFLSQGFSAEGEVALLWAQVGRLLNCGGGIFKNPGGVALSVSGAKIAGSVFLDEGLRAEGEVRLVGTQIGGRLICRGGSFKNPGGRAVNADGAKVTGNVHLADGFLAEGEVRLRGAHIGDGLSCDGGVFANPGGQALVARNLTVSGTFSWRPKERAEGVIVLEDAHVGSYVDAKATWPTGETLQMEGFTYGAIVSQPESASLAERIAWVEKNPGYSPQPYEQLAATYRRHGHDGAARKVAIAKQRARRRQAGFRWWARTWSGLLGATVGYGYRPWLAAFWVAGLWVAGVALFTWGPGHSHIMLGLKGGGQEPKFSVWTYVLDSLLPVVNLRQRDFWIPNAARPWGWLYLDFVLFAALAGWALATAVVAALTGLIRKD